MFEDKVCVLRIWLRFMDNFYGWGLMKGLKIKFEDKI
jgi:hypothetical protein